MPRQEPRAEAPRFERRRCQLSDAFLIAAAADGASRRRYRRLFIFFFSSPFIRRRFRHCLRNILTPNTPPRLLFLLMPRADISPLLLLMRHCAASAAIPPDAATCLPFHSSDIDY